MGCPPAFASRFNPTRFCRSDQDQISCGIRIAKQFVPGGRVACGIRIARQLGWKDVGHQAGPRTSHRGATCCPKVEFIEVKLLAEFTSQDSLARTNMETWAVPRHSHRDSTPRGSADPIRTRFLAEFASQNNLFLRAGLLAEFASQDNSAGRMWDTRPGRGLRIAVRPVVPRWSLSRLNCLQNSHLKTAWPGQTWRHGLSPGIRIAIQPHEVLPIRSGPDFLRNSHRKTICS